MIETVDSGGKVVSVEERAVPGGEKRERGDLREMTYLPSSLPKEFAGETMQSNGVVRVSRLLWMIVTFCLHSSGTRAWKASRHLSTSSAEMSKRMNFTGIAAKTRGMYVGDCGL